MAYAAVTSLMGTLDLHFLQSQPRLPLRDKQQIVSSLHENLGFLQESLEKSEIGYDNSGAMKDLEAEMRDVSFKAEERIEMELTTIYLQSSSETACSLLRLHGIFKEAVKQTDYLKKKLIKIKSKQQQQQLAKDSSLTRWMRRRGIGSTSSQPADLERDNITVSKFSKTASMVGCDEEFKTIMDQLTRQSAKQLQVVSIVGMGGIGKTTLAQKVYEHSSIISYFDKRAWTTVSQVYNLDQMLQCLIGCVRASSDELPKQSNVLREQRNDNLAESLRKHLKDQRYLIVVDDIWSSNAWDSVQMCFPDDNNGSRILLTSWLREVAEYAASSVNSIINMSFLNVNESWNLYCNVFGKTEFLSVFEQIGIDIVKKCKGLPLAITLVASLLSKTEEKVEKWKNVAESVIGDSNEACSRVLYLSYNQLSHHLKACFLYFGVLGEDYEIPVKKLVRLWAAEGFFRAVKHVNMEEVAMECLQDLVDRSLVIVSKQSYNGKMKRIRIHDLLRDLCLKEGGHENLLNVIRDEKLPFDEWMKSQHLFSKPYRWIGHTERIDNQIRNLENISWLSYELCRKDLFTRIPNLKKLGIKGGYIDNQDCFYNLVHLGQLETLCISWGGLRRIPCNDIPWATSFLPNLKKLKLFWTQYLPWSDMRLIGMLPNLEVLKLKHACQGPEWEPNNGGFRRLKRLIIENTLLKYWNAEGDHFPVLECLELCRCKYLQEIPSAFVDITTLALIQLNYCQDSLLTSAKWIQDEQLNNYGNSILVHSENISLKE